MRQFNRAKRVKVRISPQEFLHGKHINLPIPEAPSTLEHQVHQVSEGKRRAALLTPGAVIPKIPPHLKQIKTEHGHFVYHPKLTNPRMLKRAAKFGRLNEVLGATDGGMGPQSKQDILAKGEKPKAVIGRHKGTTVQSTLTGIDGLPHTISQTAKVTPPGGAVSVESPDKEISHRLEEMAKDGIKINSGSSTRLGMAPAGFKEVAKEAKQIAQDGGVDRIVASDAKRTMEAAQQVADANPKPVQVEPTPQLESWGQGVLEGQPKTPELQATLDALMKQYPDVVIPGQGPLTQRPGESFNQFTQGRALPFVASLMEELGRDHQQKILIAGHSQLAKALKAWIDAGTPEDFSVDPDALDKAVPEPGTLQRIWPSPKGQWEMRATDGAKENGLYYLRHGASPVNTEAYKELS